ncbi:hypothetical protein V7S43_017466 [Phytophthora oleae]|uniref:Uncharacterized protein n=1 Tax=Phytophthora oleae TaxID=2107226 RepID=A0ABD3EXG5_9STRA
MGNISSCYKSAKPETTKMDPCTPPNDDNQCAKSEASYSAQAEDAHQPIDASLSMDSPSTPGNPIAKKQTVSSPLLSPQRAGGSYSDRQN